ncbi:MAG: hypothetical protein ACYSR6_07200 [Planctomycetota bacterium]|jgi:hypothetical protein
MKKAMMLFLMLCVGVCFAAETKQVENPEAVAENEEIQLPPKESNTYWVVRSQAMMELTPFLTKKRTEFKGHLKLLGDYLMSIGQAENFLTSGINATLTPKLYAEALGKTEEFKEKRIPLSDKPLTWDQIVELAMKHVLREGYLPTDIEGEEELKMYKNICAQNEKYGRKVRKELREVVQKCINIWLYLEKIDKQAECRVFALQVKKQEREAREARRQKMVEEARARRKEQQEFKKQDAWLYRQNRLRSKYDRYYW